MKWLIGTSIRMRGLVIAVGAGLLLVGGAQVLNAPIDALPEFKPTIVEVQTEALGLSAEEVEQFITVPLEQDLLNGVAFIQDIESVSLPGLSSVVLTFEPGTDLYDARQVVAERLTQAVGVAGLPHVANTPQMLQPLSSTNRVALIRLTPQDLTPIQASVLARWVIGPRLLGVEGVANVSIFGQRERQVQVLVDPARLESAGIGVSDIVRTVGNALEVSPLTFLEASKPGTGGFIDTVNQRFQVFHEQAIKTAEELGQVPIEDRDGNAVLFDGQTLALGQIVDVVEDHQPLIGDAVCPDGECQLLVVERFPGAIAADVAAGIEHAIIAMRPGLDGLEVDLSTYRPAEYADTSATNLRRSGLVGGLLVLLALVAFLADWRRVVLAALTMAVSFSAAVGLLVLFEQPLNVMVLAGLVLGLLVVIDDAIIDVTGLSRRVRAADSRGQVPVARRIRDAMLGLRSAMLYASVIAAVAITPVFFMDGLAGAFLSPVLAAYLIVMAVSLVVAATLTPALAAVVLDGGHTARPAVWLHRVYDARVGPLVARRPVAVGVGLVALVVVVVGSPFLRTSMEPSLEERDVVVELEASPGTSLTTMRAITTEAVEALSGVVGVRSIAAHVGRAISSDQVSNVNRAEVWISLDRGAPYQETISDLRAAASKVSGASVYISSHTRQQVDELLGSSRHDIVVRIYGESPEVLEQKAAEIEQLLARIDGVVDLAVDAVPEEQTITVRTDLAAANAVGLTPGDIRRQSAILLNGITVGNLFDEQKVFDVVVWGSPELRVSSYPLEDVLIDTDGFGLVRLGTVADVRVASGPSEIRHESVFTYLDVVANASGRSIHAVAADIELALDGVAFPLEHHAELLGEFEQARAHRIWMIGLWAAAALFVFLLLQAALNSWRLAAALFGSLTVPVAGVVAAVGLFGARVTIGSAAAFFGVIGLALRQSILSIRHYQHLRRDEGLPFDRDLVVRGTRDRLVPTVATVLAGSLFLVPLIIPGPSIGFEIVHPMAVAMVGGLLATGLFTVLVVPAIYLALATGEDALIWGQELFDLSLIDEGREMAPESGR